MSCRIQSRITAIFILVATLFHCSSTHGPVFDRIQSKQVERTLQNQSKLEEADRIKLEITEQQSDIGPSENPERGSHQDTHLIFDETKNLKRHTSLLVIRQFNETPEQKDADVKMFQSDSAGFKSQVVQGKKQLSSSRITEDWLQMRPQVQCSPAAIILTAKGWNYIHFFVDRVGEPPVSLLHLPSQCGYIVRATWRDLVLVAPYDGCYVLQQNGSYVLPLRWWGMPVSISCTMTPASASASPSGFCSNLGITLRIEGSWKSLEKYSIKVNEEWLPLVSNTCAYRMDSANEDLVLFIPFTVNCAKDGGSSLNVLLDEKMYTLTCQPQDNPSATSSQIIPFDPTLTEPEITNMNQPQRHTLISSDQIAKDATEIFGLSYEPPSGNLQLSIPKGHPSYQHFAYLTSQFYNQKPISPESHTPNYTVLNETSMPQKPQPPQVPQKPQPPQVPQKPQPPQVPQKPQPPQVPQKPQPPQVTQGQTFPILSPVLTCNTDYLKASLDFAKITSIKVKDVKRKVWVPVTSASANCGYSLQPKGRSVVFFSPLPACHSYTASPLLLSLSVKFWDTSLRRHRALRLQCPYASLSSTHTNLPTPAASHLSKPIFTTSQPAKQESQPSHSYKVLNLYSNSSQLKDSPFLSQNLSVPLLNPSKPTVTSFQHSKDLKPAFLSSKLTRQTPPLASQMLQPEVLCRSNDMGVKLPSVPITGLTVDSPSVGIKEGIKGMLLDEAPSHCGYLIKKNRNGAFNIILPYTSCHMAYKDGQYRIVLKYSTVGGRRIEASLSCQVPVNHECNLPAEQRLTCGASLATAAECRDLGCCYFPNTRTCYYPMDECTADRHFVFSIPASLTEPPLSPALLATVGNSSCTSQRVVADMALFKIPLDGCGVHKYEVGNTVIYMVEILNTLQSVTLNYGTITRDSPFRLLVECRYLPGTVASVGYLVKSPSLGPSIQAQGVFGVQLRIAKDQQYSSYYPQYHRPLRTLLGKPLYLEVRLLNPVDPSAVLLVHYCLAYPRSVHSAWVLIYDGCPNPLDVTLSHAPPPTPSEGLANHIRRFTVSTFQFLDKSRKEMAADVEEEEKKEEIYFMCATEVCLPSQGPCMEGCIDRPVNSPAVKS